MSADPLGAEHTDKAALSNMHSVLKVWSLPLVVLRQISFFFLNYSTATFQMKINYKIAVMQFKNRFYISCNVLLQNQAASPMHV